MARASVGGTSKRRWAERAWRGMSERGWDERAWVGRASVGGASKSVGAARWASQAARALRGSALGSPITMTTPKDALSAALSAAALALLVDAGVAVLILEPCTLVAWRERP